MTAKIYIPWQLTKELSLESGTTNERMEVRMRENASTSSKHVQKGIVSNENGMIWLQAWHIHERTLSSCSELLSCLMTKGWATSSNVPKPYSNTDIQCSLIAPSFVRQLRHIYMYTPGNSQWDSPQKAGLQMKECKLMKANANASTGSKHALQA